MAAPWSFAGQSGPIPLSELDDNFTWYSQLIHLTVNGTGTITSPNYATQLQVQLNNFSWYANISTALPADIYGTAANVVRTGGNAYTVGGFFTGQGATGTSQLVWGIVTQAIAQPGSTSGVTGAEHGAANMTNNNTNVKTGVYVVFKDRPDGQAGTTQALGPDQFNAVTRGIWIESQPRSTTGEKCGWRRGIYFGEYSLDLDYLGTAIGIDFGDVHYYGGTDPTTAYRMTAAIRLRGYQSILWNGGPGDPTDPGAPVRTYCADSASPAARWVITNTNAERFGVDVVTGELYVNGKLPVAFRVHKNGVNQSPINDQTWTQVTYSTRNFDNNNDYSLGSNSFTPPANTTCLLQAKVTLQGTTSPTRLVVAVYKNGVIYDSNDAFDSVGLGRPLQAQTCTVVRQGAAGTDVYTVFAWHDAGAPRTIDGTAEETSFSAVTAH